MECRRRLREQVVHACLDKAAELDVGNESMSAEFVKQRYPA